MISAASAGVFAVASTSWQVFPLGVNLEIGNKDNDKLFALGHNDRISNFHLEYLLDYPYLFHNTPKMRIRQILFVSFFLFEMDDSGNNDFYNSDYD